MEESLSGTENSWSEGLNSLILGVVVFSLLLWWEQLKTSSRVTSHNPVCKINSSSQTYFPPVILPSNFPSAYSCSDLFQNPSLISKGRFWVKSPWWSVRRWVEPAQWCDWCWVEVSAATQVDSPGPYRVIILPTSVMATVAMGVVVSTAMVVDVLLLPPVGSQRVTKHLRRNMRWVILVLNCTIQNSSWTKWFYLWYWLCFTCSNGRFPSPPVLLLGTWVQFPACSVAGAKLRLDLCRKRWTKVLVTWNERWKIIIVNSAIQIWIELK